ncbi:MAG: two-component system, OmpR family, sensor kinase [Pseudonocardiales bacterium]|nr:two-component system, OmpR family, sensor kinase [Pseudonocardiales bacterium]
MRSLPHNAAELLVQGAAPRGLAPQIAREIAVVGAAITVVVVMSRLTAVLQAVSVGHTALLLSVTACAFAAMAAILAALAGRLTSDHRLTWLSSTLIFYSVVDVPATTTSWLVAPVSPVVSGARMAAGAVAVGLLCASVWPPTKLWPSLRWLGAVIGLVLTLGAAGVAQCAPSVAAAVTTFLPLRAGLPLLGVVAGVWLAVLGWRRHSTALARVGLGFAVIAIAHATRLATDSGLYTDSKLTFASIRLLGVVLVLIGMSQLTYVMLRAVDDRHNDHQEQLRLAQLNLDRFAERDHELRNGLAGLAGATNALAGSPVGEKDELRTAVASELARLDALLGNSGREAERVAAYRIREVLRDVVLLWRTTGMEIRLDVEPGLRVKGVPDTLAQVVTNVVANCARHAAGSPVRVQAFRRGAWVRIRISDSGPGLGPLSEIGVFGRRSCDQAAGGQGLGLYICRKLLAEDGGSIRMLPAQPGRPGCTVVIELPAAAIVARRAAQRAVSSSA